MDIVERICLCFSHVNLFAIIHTCSLVIKLMNPISNVPYLTVTSACVITKKFTCTSPQLILRE